MDQRAGRLKNNRPPKGVRKSMPRYELYARALRLSGFGLAHPLNWNQAAWGAQGFAPTPRGRRLMKILRTDESADNGGH
jgi:hypothetical protein